MKMIAALVLAAGALNASNKTDKPAPSPLDLYIEEAMQRSNTGSPNDSAGSIWSPSARFGDLAADFRAGRIDDMVTIQVIERASAVAKGTTKSARSSSAQSSIGALGGVTRAAGPWANLASAETQTALDGQGETTRETTLTTTLTARVTHVLPNGYLVIEGAKNVVVNSENPLITIRGVVRPVDLSTGNTVRSDRVGQMEVRVNGKGVVGDAIRRPFFLYRLLLGLLPF